MALTVETGSGIAGAESYASTATIDAYWAARTHSPNYAIWKALTAAVKEGCAREASAYMDATWGQFYKGVRTGYVQGLQWPRTRANDGQGYPLPALPQQLIDATCELAVRASVNPLKADQDRSGRISRLTEKVDVLETTVEYSGAASSEAEYGFVLGMLAPILNGSQPGASAPNWNWR